MKPGAQPNQSLIGGIATLQALAIAEEPIGCRELARSLGFDVTRVNRLLKTLAYIGLVRQTANRKYMAGPGMHVLAAQALFASGLLKRALPRLEALRSFGYVVAMGVLWKTNVTYLYHAPPDVTGNEALGRIGLYPATKGGIGLAMLAGYDDDYIETLYEGKDIIGFPKGLPSLLDYLQTIREAGYANVLVIPKKKQHTVAVTVGNPINSAIGLSGSIKKRESVALANELKRVAVEIETVDTISEDDESPNHKLFHMSPV